MSVAKGNLFYVDHIEVTVYYTEAGAPVETVVAMEFPMRYIQSPEKSKQLRSKVSGATVIKTSMDFPETLVKKGRGKSFDQNGWKTKINWSVIC